MGLVAGCGSSDDTSSTTDGGGSGESGGKKIAFLLPQTGVPRFERFDKPYFEAAVKRYCADCEVLYANAQNEDAAKQQQQAEAALSNGADAVVIQAVDGKAAKVLADQAGAQGVPYVAYERQIEGSDNVKGFVTFDSYAVGQLQGDTLLRGLEAIGSPRGPVVMLNGAPTDSSGDIYGAGARSRLEPAGVEIVATLDTPNWDPAKAQAQMDQWITKFGGDGFTGVYAANGGIAGGAIASMKAAGLDLKQHPVTGQDADLVEIQRIVAEEQFMTVYKPISAMADTAAQIAIALANGEEPPSSLFDAETDMGAAAPVPTAEIPVVAVTRDNIADTVIEDGFYTADEICIGKYKAACEDAGLVGSP